MCIKLLPGEGGNANNPISCWLRYRMIANSKHCLKRYFSVLQICWFQLLMVVSLRFISLLNVSILLLRSISSFIISYDLCSVSKRLERVKCALSTQWYTEYYLETQIRLSSGTNSSGLATRCVFWGSFNLSSSCHALLVSSLRCCIIAIRIMKLWNRLSCLW